MNKKFVYQVGNNKKVKKKKPNPLSSHRIPTSYSRHLGFKTRDRYQPYRLRFL